MASRAVIGPTESKNGTQAHLGYPPARWRGGSSDAAKLRSEGWGDYACSEFARWRGRRRLRASGTPTPDPSPPLASLAGGGERRRSAHLTHRVSPGSDSVECRP